MECPRCGHLSASSALSGLAGRIVRHAKGIELQEAVPVGVTLTALLVIVIAHTVANTRQVKLSWLVGTSHASLVWIILAAAVLGWLLGITASVVFRPRTRRRRPT
jgi:uncharacterized integral membrane protein